MSGPTMAELLRALADERERLGMSAMDWREGVLIMRHLADCYEALEANCQGHNSRGEDGPCECTGCRALAAAEELRPLLGGEG